MAVSGKSASTLNIIFLLATKKWVTTNSAEVRISVNATTKEKEKESNVIQEQVLKKPEALSNGSNGKTWHIDSFNMAQDQSGLEELRMEAHPPDCL